MTVGTDIHVTLVMAKYSLSELLASFDYVTSVSPPKKLKMGLNLIRPWLTNERKSK